MPTVVPFSSGDAPARSPQPASLDPTWLMLAAAQMHKEGRLVDRGTPSDMPDIPSTTRGGERTDPEPPPKPPKEYWPSNGNRKDGPSMMT